MSFMHADLASGRWHTLTVCEQMANIGSEVHRVIGALEKKDHGRAELAGERALELFDLTLADARWNGARKREIARAREVFCDMLWGANEYHTNHTSFDTYFLYFGIAARAGR